MAFCSNCGAQVDGKFCPSCGKPFEGEAQASPNASYQQPAAAPPAAGGMEANVASTLCYVLGFITGILFLILEPYNKNRAIRFHAFQSIFLSVAMIAISMALNIILPFAMLFVVGPLFSLAGFVLWIFMLVKTYQNQKVVLPVIGPLAEKQA